MGRPEPFEQSSDILEKLKDPEYAREFADLFRRLRRLAQTIGDSSEVARAISGSFGVFDRTTQRAEYDQLRHMMVQYLESLDDPELAGGFHVDAEFQSSLDMPSEDVQSLAEILRLQKDRQPE